MVEMQGIMSFVAPELLKTSSPIRIFQAQVSRPVPRCHFMSRKAAKIFHAEATKGITQSPQRVGFTYRILG